MVARQAGARRAVASDRFPLASLAGHVWISGGTSPGGIHPLGAVLAQAKARRRVREMPVAHVLQHATADRARCDATVATGPSAVAVPAAKAGASRYVAETGSSALYVRVSATAAPPVIVHKEVIAVGIPPRAARPGNAPEGTVSTEAHPVPTPAIGLGATRGAVRTLAAGDRRERAHRDRRRDQLLVEDSAPPAGEGQRRARPCGLTVTAGVPVPMRVGPLTGAARIAAFPQVAHLAVAPRAEPTGRPRTRGRLSDRPAMRPGRAPRRAVQPLGAARTAAFPQAARPAVAPRDVPTGHLQIETGHRRSAVTLVALAPRSRGGIARRVQGPCKTVLALVRAGTRTVETGGVSPVGEPLA